MIEKLEDVPAGIDGLHAEGRITREDYDLAVRPLVDKAIRQGQDIRALVELTGVTAITPAAMWTDVELGVRAYRRWTRCALLTDLHWARTSTRIAAFFLPFPVRVFDLTDREQAIAWLQSQQDTAHIHPHLDPSSEVLIIDADSPLATADIDALASTLDSWLAQHAELRGLVVHAPAVPGWQNMAGLTSHVKFVRQHHRRIRRLAIAMDGPAAQFAPKLAGHLVHPEIRHFSYHELDAARSWAAAG